MSIVGNGAAAARRWLTLMLMRSEGMVEPDAALIDDLVSRRCPELSGVIAPIGPDLLAAHRGLLRRAIVDELCEQHADDAQAQRRVLALEDLLLRLER